MPALTFNTPYHCAIGDSVVTDKLPVVDTPANQTSAKQFKTFLIAAVVLAGITYFFINFKKGK